MAKPKKEKEQEQLPLFGPNEIDASPTKDLFITMLIRDLTLEDAIGDLVDNCADGAKSLHPDKKYKGLKVHITANKDCFVIDDNCGGIDVEIAKNYAFKFGRDPGFHPVKYSVGNFGIGMKRALFKLGSKFEIVSTWQKSYFRMNIDVNQWRNNPKWVFEFAEQKTTEKKNPPSQVGTKISVLTLNKDVSAQFTNANFIKKLKDEIELENLYNIYNGLEIKINGEQLQARQLNFLVSKDFKVGHYFEKYLGNKVNVRIYVGVSSDEYDEGGWYIFCNDRLILGPDQSAVTGWGDGAAKYHGQYQRFRGLVFFESDDANLLPWNTTKNGLDKTSGIYQAVKLKMVELMKTVLSFLNKLKEERENDNPQSNWVLYNRLAMAQATKVSDLSEQNMSSSFSFPAPAAKPAAAKDSMNLISYSKRKEEVDKVKKYFKVNTNREVGERTFEYFLDMEINN